MSLPKHKKKDWVAKLAIFALGWLILNFLGLILIVAISHVCYDLNVASYERWRLVWSSPLKWFWLKGLLILLLTGGLVITGVIVLGMIFFSLRDDSLPSRENLFKKTGKKLSLFLFGIAFSLGVGGIFPYGIAQQISSLLSAQSVAEVFTNEQAKQLEVVSHLGALSGPREVHPFDEIHAIQIQIHRYQRFAKGSPSGHQILEAELQLHLKSGKVTPVAFTRWQISWYQRETPPSDIIYHPKLTTFCQTLGQQIGVPCSIQVDQTSMSGKPLSATGLF